MLTIDEMRGWGLRDSVPLLKWIERPQKSILSQAINNVNMVPMDCKSDAHISMGTSCVAFLYEEVTA